MTETKVPDILDAPEAHKQSLQNSIQRVLAQLNTQINTAIAKGNFEVKIELCLTGATGILEQYRETADFLRKYYQDRKYTFESRESGYYGSYTVSW